MTYYPDDAPSSGAPADGERAGSRRAMGCALEVVETLVLTLVIYLVIHNFVAQPFEVEQSSMFPTIVQNEYILIDKLTPRFDDYQRGDVVVFQPPSGYEQGGVPFIKRIVAIPGDTVSLENGRLFIAPDGGNPTPVDEPYLGTESDGSQAPTLCRDAECTEDWEVPEGTFFVLGDNRAVSQDSRTFGPIDRELIVGRAWLRYFPLDRVSILDRPTYANLSSEAGALPYAGSSATIQASISRP